MLDLSDNDLDSECIEFLMKSSLPNLTQLKFQNAIIDEKDTIDLLNSNFMSGIKELDLSFSIEDFTNNFYESVSESKYLNQITHLNIRNSDLQHGRVDLLLKNMINLEHLALYYDLSLVTILLTNGNYKNLRWIDISLCQIKVQEFANLFISPNLPNLETIKAEYLQWDEIDNAVTVFPPNSQSSITELDFTRFKPEQFPSLFDHCPKLKKLTMQPTVDVSAEAEKVFTQMMKSPNLSHLKFLNISFNGLVEEIFINPIYSNIKELYLAYGQINIDNVRLLSNCTNLVNLTSLDMHSLYVNQSSLLEACSKALRNNPTFSKLKRIRLPVYISTTYEGDDTHLLRFDQSTYH